MNVQHSLISADPLSDDPALNFFFSPSYFGGSEMLSGRFSYWADLIPFLTLKEQCMIGTRAIDSLMKLLLKDDLEGCLAAVISLCDLCMCDGILQTIIMKKCEISRYFSLIMQLPDSFNPRYDSNLWKSFAIKSEEHNLDLSLSQELSDSGISSSQSFKKSLQPTTNSSKTSAAMNLLTIPATLEGTEDNPLPQVCVDSVTNPHHPNHLVSVSSTPSLYSFDADAAADTATSGSFNSSSFTASPLALSPFVFEQGTMTTSPFYFPHSASGSDTMSISPSYSFYASSSSMHDKSYLSPVISHPAALFHSPTATVPATPLASPPLITLHTIKYAIAHFAFCFIRMRPTFSLFAQIVPIVRIISKDSNSFSDRVVHVATEIIRIYYQNKLQLSLRS